MKQIISVFIGMVLFVLINMISINISLASKQIEVAVTFDDLPFQSATKENEVISAEHTISVTKKIIAILKKHHIPSTWGMFNAKAVVLHPKMEQALKIWIAAGNKLGNHTYSHMDLAQVSANDFIMDIKKNTPLLQKLMKQKNYKVFRYPFLAYGNTQQKYQKVRNYLLTSGYQIAYVTMDFSDSEWSPVYRRCSKKDNKKGLQWLTASYLDQSLKAVTIARALSQQLFHRDIKYILLLHFSDIQAQVLDQLLSSYKEQGVKFISLESALQDLVYQIDPKIYRLRAYTLLNRIRLSRKLNNPEIVKKLYATLPENKLNSMCR